MNEPKRYTHEKDYDTFRCRGFIDTTKTGEGEWIRADDPAIQLALRWMKVGKWMKEAMKRKYSGLKFWTNTDGEYFVEVDNKVYQANDLPSAIEAAMKGIDQ